MTVRRKTKFIFRRSTSLVGVHLNRTGTQTSSRAAKLAALMERERLETGKLVDKTIRKIST